VELLRLCQGIEVALGRDRKGERAPRTVDIDLLLYGEGVVEGRDFRVPHRAISRAYNLVGLAELDPSVRVPGLGGGRDHRPEGTMALRPGRGYIEGGGR
jgi:2-amino-4-hydroxy-6-hydroxymethyldihydropteridine diphosphokinase